MPRFTFSPKICVELQQCERESATFYFGVRLASANRITQSNKHNVFMLDYDICRRLLI